MSDGPLPQSDLILCQTEDGRTGVRCRFEDETLWLDAEFEKVAKELKKMPRAKKPKPPKK